jgi:prevent-host-death family protein
MSIVPRIIPISDLRQDAAGIIKEMGTSRDPVVITQRGRATAVLVSAQGYQETQRELAILKMLARSEREIEQGATHDLASVLAEADEILKRP